MGVKDLWGIISPTSELIKLQDIEEKVIAIDLSCWICDSQNVNMGGSVIRPHLRNLFFRTISIVKAGLLPVFVLEGDAPCLKLQTIQQRILKRNHTVKNSASGSRSRLKGLLSQCRELLTIMGLPCIQAVGEAEASCAALAYHQLVNAVITQDSDVFLYGADVVFRNFTGNQQKTTVEKYKATILQEKLCLCRESLICLALILGCDYLPAGIPGVGKENALKLVRYWNSSGVAHPLQRLQDWHMEGDLTSSQVSQLQKLRKSERHIEDIIKEKALRTPGFPFVEVIEEFFKKLEKPKVTIRWGCPDVFKLVRWCVNMLGWETAYSFEKVLPFATFWIISNSLADDTYYLKPVRINRKCVHQGIRSYDVTWKLSEEYRKIFSEEFSAEFKITDPAYLITKRFPSLVQEYEDTVLSNKKGKAKGKKRTERLTGGKDVVKGHRKRKEDNTKTLHRSSSEESVDEAELSRIINNLDNLKISLKPKRENKIASKSHALLDVNKTNDHCNMPNLPTVKFNVDTKNIARKSKIKVSALKFELSPRQTTLDNFCLKKENVVAVTNLKSLDVNMSKTTKDISVINISSDFEESFSRPMLNRYENYVPNNFSFLVSTPLASSPSLSESMDASFLPNLDLRLQNCSLAAEEKFHLCEFQKKGVEERDIISDKGAVGNSLLFSHSCQEPNSGIIAEYSVNESKDLFDDSETSDQVPCITSRFIGKKTESVKDVSLLEDSFANKEDVLSSCLNLLDSFSDLSLTSISTPVNRAKISLTITHAPIIPLSENPILSKNKHESPNGNPTNLKHITVNNSTPEKSGLTKNDLFETPKVETLSLAERLRIKYAGGMNDVLDDM